MSKINLSVLIITAALLSSCGFHTPIKNTPLNASIVSEKSNAFASELKTRFNQSANQNLTIQVGPEVQKQQTSSYTSGNVVNSYTLNLSVPVKVYNADQKLLLAQDLKASLHLSKITSSQADRLQIEESYTQLRNTLIKKLIRRLSKLNEN
ncbi:LPS assembly lipoprotein LptE [Candidatus Thioglobus sp.]|nr:LPS assembly lipoprotein LptE [Candidatus Thioglobus sp.]